MTHVRLSDVFFGHLKDIWPSLSVRVKVVVPRHFNGPWAATKSSAILKVGAR